MKLQILTLFAFVLLAASCSDGADTTDTAQNAEPKACDCVDVYKTEDAAQKAKCDELRKTEDFDNQFRKCMAASITGRSPEEVNMIKSENLKMQAPSDGDYVFSPEKSKLVWTGSKITGSKHSGLITLKNGMVSFTNGEITFAKLVLDMGSISCMDQDLPDDEKAKLIGHLTSEDFFDAGNHPEAYFAFEKAQTDGARAEIEGTLNIKGIEKPISTSVIFSSTGENGAVLTGSMVIDRTEWDVRYGSGKFFEGLGDNLINDNMTLNFQLKGSK